MTSDTFMVLPLSEGDQHNKETATFEEHTELPDSSIYLVTMSGAPVALS